MSIYEILLDDLKDGEPVTLNKLDTYNVTNHGIHIEVPLQKRKHYEYPDDMVKIDRINRDISKADDIKRGANW